MTKIKKISLSLVAIATALSFNGCGGGGGIDSLDNTTQYDMWSYILSDKTIIKKLDKYDTNSNFQPSGGTYLNFGELRETVYSSSYVMRQEIVNGNLTDSVEFQLLGNEIQVIGGNKINRYRTLNSTEYDCTLTNHYDTLTPMEGYTFNDVIKIQCDGWAEFYAKEKGLIFAQGEDSYTWNGTTTVDYYITIVNNL